ncbi:MAG: biliverdin-producing heme oxygenase [Pseudomonadota bacterium]|nr:biliverdin-producing heme oxygenase [Pseudomonadota bacterium]
MSSPVPLPEPSPGAAGIAPPPEGARFGLRDRTAAAHARVDSLYSRFDLADAEGYAGFLTAQARAFPAVEASLTGAGAAGIIPDWRDRLRTDALMRDLAATGAPSPALLPPPAYSSEAEILGGAYVLEGSRLGGALLRRSAPEGWPTAFMDASDPRLWRAFVTLLDQRLTRQTDLDQAISAALATFAVFERSAALALGQDPL